MAPRKRSRPGQAGIRDNRERQEPPEHERAGAHPGQVPERRDRCEKPYRDELAGNDLAALRRTDEERLHRAPFFFAGGQVDSRMKRAGHRPHDEQEGEELHEHVAKLIGGLGGNGIVQSPLLHLSEPIGGRRRRGGKVAVLRSLILNETGAQGDRDGRTAPRA